MTAPPPDVGNVLTCSVTDGFAQWLSSFDGSVAITTYQAGKLVLVGWDGRQVTVMPRHFDKPMGLAVDWPRLALATRNNPKLTLVDPLHVNVYDVVNSRYIVLSQDALQRLTEALQA